MVSVYPLKGGFPATHPGLHFDPLKGGFWVALPVIDLLLFLLVRSGFLRERAPLSTLLFLLGCWVGRAISIKIRRGRCRYMVEDLLEVTVLRER